MKREAQTCTMYNLELLAAHYYYVTMVQYVSDSSQYILTKDYFLYIGLRKGLFNYTNRESSLC